MLVEQAGRRGEVDSAAGLEKGAGVRAELQRGEPAALRSAEVRFGSSASRGEQALGFELDQPLLLGLSAVLRRSRIGEHDVQAKTRAELASRVRQKAEPPFLARALVRQKLRRLAAEDIDETQRELVAE